MCTTWVPVPHHVVSLSVSLCLVQGYLAPTKLDPRLLNPAYVFKGVEPPSGASRGIDVLHRKAGERKRNRDVRAATLCCCCPPHTDLCVAPLRETRAMMRAWA